MTTERLEKLLALQEIDVRIAGLDERRRALPKRRAEVAHEITTLEEECAGLEEAIGVARLDRRQQEGGLEVAQEQLKRYETQLNEVKTNVAYSALLTEIQGVGREIKEIEDLILDLMGTQEAHEARVEAIAAELEEKRAAAAEELAEIDGELATVDGELKALDVDRQAVAVYVDPRLNRVYDRLRRGRRFPAIVALHGEACGGCYAHMPPQVVWEVRHGGEFHACEACGKLVYSAEAPHVAEEPADAR